MQNQTDADGRVTCQKHTLYGEETKNLYRGMGRSVKAKDNNAKS